MGSGGGAPDLAVTLVDMASSTAPTAPADGVDTLDPTVPADGAGAIRPDGPAAVDPAVLTDGTDAAEQPPTHRTPEELVAFLPRLLAAPRDLGTLELVVRRPAVGRREVLAEGELDLTVGLVGDTWFQRGSNRTPDGGPHPDMQLNVMSARMVAFLAVDPARRPLAGDQLYLDLDLSHENLPAGTHLVIGDPAGRGAVIEVTPAPHTGCAKFVERFGAEAMGFVNGAAGRPLRLRGLNARVVVPGRVRTGDPVAVRRPG